MKPITTGGLNSHRPHEWAIMVALNMSKAFVTIRHDILLEAINESTTFEKVGHQLFTTKATVYWLSTWTQSPNQVYCPLPTQLSFTTRRHQTYHLHRWLHHFTFREWHTQAMLVLGQVLVIKNHGATFYSLLTSIALQRTSKTNSKPRPMALGCGLKAHLARTKKLKPKPIK